MSLELLLSEELLHLLLDEGVIWGIDLCGWEQVLDDGIEERQIVFEEFGLIGVLHGSDEHGIFIVIGESALKSSSHDKHGLNGSHTEIVMVLLG